jgi:carbamoyltransferase
MKSWGLSFGSHDAAISVIEDDRLIFASHSERFSKIKDDGNLHQSLVDHVISEFGVPDQIYYYESHWKKRARYLLSGQVNHLFEPTPGQILARYGIDGRLVPTDHHHSHAAAGYYTSGFDDAVVVVVDAIGEIETLTIWEGVGNDLRKIYRQNYPHSLGLFYSAMTAKAGFKPNGEEYIFMGMAAYGDGKNAVGYLNDSLFLDDPKIIVRLRNNLHRGAGGLINDNIDPRDLAAATQELYENNLRKILDWAHMHSTSRNLVVMGGCALNCVANAKIRSWNSWDNIWIMPNPGDAGSSLGAILANRRMHIKWPGPYLGYEIKGEYPIGALLSRLKDTGIAAVASGRAEFGPRALGNRSILADPRISDIKTRMNWLKKREQFRPFAAAIPEELASEFFDMDGAGSSPYMQYVFKCKDPDRFPGIAHVDNTSRIQTVNPQQHRDLYQLLIRWYNDTGCPMLVNTSLNIKNQPLVNDEKDAMDFAEKYGIPVLGPSICK